MVHAFSPEALPASLKELFRCQPISASPWATIFRFGSGRHDQRHQRGHHLSTVTQRFLRAFVSSGFSPNPSGCRAHEVRAWASFWAWAHNVSLTISWTQLTCVASARSSFICVRSLDSTKMVRVEFLLWLWPNRPSLLLPPPNGDNLRVSPPSFAYYSA